jgi:hypothetical protein
MNKPTTIEDAELAAVTGGIVEGGCVVPDPMVTRFLESLKKVPPPNGLPTQLGSIGTSQPK